VVRREDGRKTRLPAPARPLRCPHGKSGFERIASSLFCMRILLMGSASDDLPTALDAAGVRYERHSPKLQPGVIINATGEVLQFIGDGIPWAAIAACLIAWLRVRASRKVIVTTKGNKVVHIEGYSVNEVEQLLAQAKEVAALDTKKSKEAKE